MKNEGLDHRWQEPLEISEERFASRLAHEVLRSERLRTTLLAGSFGFGFFYTVFVVKLMKQWQTEPVSNAVVMIAMAGLTCYELLIRQLISQRIKRKQLVAGWVWYLNALVETSVPTIIIFFVHNSFSNPIYALFAPPLLMYFGFIILSTLRLDFKMSLFTGGVAAIEYAALVCYFLMDMPDAVGEAMFRQHTFHLSKAIILLFGGIMAGFVAREIRRRTLNSFAVLEERNQILDVFGQQTAPAIVEELLRHGTDTTSRHQYVCIMFLDIRGFTAFSERRSPQEVVDYLNTLFDFMIDIVHRHHGIIPQLLGDGFMAIFGAPLSHGNDSENAVKAARAILKRLAEEVGAGRIPPTRIGIGLHAGEGLVGSVGSAIHKEYKVTGDVVNLASRIEQLNKEFDSQLLVSESVYGNLEESEQEIMDKQTVEIRGRKEPVTIYRLA